MKYIVYVLAQILDILAFAFLFMYSQYIYPVLAFHALLYFISVYCYRGFENTIEDLPLYLILFLPVIGGLFITLFYFSTTYFYRDNLPLSDYEQMLEAEERINQREKISYEIEIKTMSYMDLLQYIGPEKKKEILIDSQYKFDINNTRILKRGLEAEDKEVQHYSATLLNTRENDFTNEISYLSEQYNLQQDPYVLQKLATAYKDYIDSGLIEEDSMEIFTREYIDTLNKQIEIKHYDLETLTSLFGAYIRTKNLIKAEEINKKIEKEFRKKKIVLLNELCLMHEKGDYEGVANRLNSMDEKTINSSVRLIELKAFYRNGGM